MWRRLSTRLFTRRAVVLSTTSNIHHHSPVTTDLETLRVLLRRQARAKNGHQWEIIVSYGGSPRQTRKGWAYAS